MSDAGLRAFKSGHAAQAIEAFDPALRLKPYDVRSLALKTLALAETYRGKLRIIDHHHFAHHAVVR